MTDTPPHAPVFYVDLDRAFEIGMNYLAEGNTREAYAVWSKMSAVYPNYPACLLLRAELCERAGQNSMALSLTKDVLATYRRSHSYKSLSHALKLLKNNGFIPTAALDIGAHKGMWTDTFKSVFPHSKSFMIEAQPNSKQYLDNIISCYGNSIDYSITLLGSCSTEATPFFVASDGTLSTGSSLYEEQGVLHFQQVNLPMRRLDELVGNHPWRPFNLMKLDVQGGELDVLAGSANIIDDVEVLIIESSLAECNNGAPSLFDYYERLNKLGFVLVNIFGMTRDRNENLLQFDGVFVRKDSKLRPVPPFIGSVF